jgi:uncharacterized protein (DUF2141 family)
MKKLFAGLICGAALLFVQMASAATVRVVISNAQPNGTFILVSLCAGGLEADFCKIGTRQSATQPNVQVQFTEVPPGRYAVVAFQDLFGTGSLTRTKMGLPLEPFAISNNAGRSRRPTFEQAAFGVEEPGTTIRLRLQMISPRAEP